MPRRCRVPLALPGPIALLDATALSGVDVRLEVVLLPGVIALLGVVVLASVVVLLGAAALPDVGAPPDAADLLGVIVLRGAAAPLATETRRLASTRRATAAQHQSVRRAL
ncbi:hypothetical protein [Nocardia pseudovaccinii]|uniref:hypothetical protein n=1 Tax=Nocardia pseudovaccinii TaxID=189540 RepID=UPI0007A3B792|nr:hypothetical protein [Nocardia pseudovaccinii]